MAGISALCERWEDRDSQMENDSGSECLSRKGASVHPPRLGYETPHPKLTALITCCYERGLQT